jgi:hypothetical protein
MSEVPITSTWEKFFNHNKLATSNKFIKSIIEKISDGSTYKSAHEIFSKEPGDFLMDYSHLA